MELDGFNALDRQQAAALIRPCLDVDRWIETVVDARPYDDLGAIEQIAADAALPMTDAELTSALAHHPRIGERAAGGDAEATLSRNEQAGLSPDEITQQRLQQGNRAYEERFGHVFLIRAAGRSAEEILAQLEERLGHDAQTEKPIVAEQLHQIATLRLKGLLQS